MISSISDNAPAQAQNFHLGVDLRKLRAGYAAADPLWRSRIDHFLWMARHEEAYPAWHIGHLHLVQEGLVRPLYRPDERTYCFLAFLLTGETAFAEAAKRELFQAAESVAEREKGDWTQLHCWCDAFPFARWIFLSEWIWETPVLTAADRNFLQERFLYYLWAHPFQRLRARPVENTPCNNQNAAMAFACVVGGHLFGQKYGEDSRAKKMLDLGLLHLRKFLTAFPKGGYSFEGSIYMGGINSFLISLGLELIRAGTGEDLFDCAESSACASPREVLQAVMRLSSPGGLLHPWDHYAYTRANYLGQAAAYLALRTGETSALQFLDERGLLEEPAHLGWGFDQTLWSLLWRLQAGDLARGKKWEFTFAEPTVNAAATGPEQRLFFLQMWDESHWPPLRAHFNPNSILMEYDGAPLLLDGLAVEAPKKREFGKPEYRFRREDMNQWSHFGGGSIGAHNTIFLDGEEHYVPSVKKEGALVFFRSENGVTLFEGDSTDCYRPRYDVTQVRRAALILGDSLVLIRDRIVSQTPHKITWRAHARAGEAQVENGYFLVRTPDRVRLEICTPGGEHIEHRPFAAEQPEGKGAEAHGPGHGSLEGKCHEVSYQAQGNDVTLYTLLVPTPELEPWLTLRGGWRWAWARTEAEAEALRKPWTGGEPIDFSRHSWFYTTGRHEPGIGVYRHEFETEGILPSEVSLRLPLLLRSTRIWINGHEFILEIPPENPPLTPPLLAIGAALVSGKNVIEIISPSTLETALHGEIALLVPAVLPPASQLREHKDGTLELKHHGTTAWVDWRSETCTVRRAEKPDICFPLSSESPAPAQPHPPVFSPNPTTPEPPPAQDREALLHGIRSPEWRKVLEALEAAEGAVDPEIVQAALHVLEREMATHPTLPARIPEDISWYRVKAAAIRVLGGARFSPAVDLLGTLLLGLDFYPVRVASAQALGQIGNAPAIDYLRQVRPDDEGQTVTTSALWLDRLNGSRPPL